jgi:hypothetical protein
MKPDTKLDWEKEVELIKRKKEIEDVLTEIVFPAYFNLEELGYSMIRIFFYPEGKKEFDPQETRLLRGILERTFEFKNKPGWDGKTEYSRRQHMWVRTIREYSGEFFWWREVNRYPDANIMFFIENAPSGKCKLVQKEKVVKYFEADCSEETEEPIA